MLSQFYVRELRINSVCSDVCLLTLLRRMTARMNTVSVCRCLLCLPRTQPLFSGRKPISQLPNDRGSPSGFLLFPSVSLCLCLFIHLSTHMKLHHSSVPGLYLTSANSESFPPLDQPHPEGHFNLTAFCIHHWRVHIVEKECKYDFM